MALAQQKQQSAPSIFAGIKEAEIFPVRQFFDPLKDVGTYKLKVNNLAAGVGKLSDQAFFSGNFTILEAPEGASKRVGQDVAVTIMKNKNKKYESYFLKDVKQMISAITNSDDIDENTIEQATSEANPLEGEEVMVDVTANSKDGGKTYTRTAFYPV